MSLTLPSYIRIMELTMVFIFDQLDRVRYEGPQSTQPAGISSLPIPTSWFLGKRVWKITSAFRGLLLAYLLLERRGYVWCSGRV